MGFSRLQVPHQVVKKWTKIVLPILFFDQIFHLLTQFNRVLDSLPGEDEQTDFCLRKRSFFDKGLTIVRRFFEVDAFSRVIYAKRFGYIPNYPDFCTP